MRVSGRGTKVCLGRKGRLAEARWYRLNQGDWAVFSRFWGSLKKLKEKGFCLPGLFECHLPVDSEAEEHHAEKP